MHPDLTYDSAPRHAPLWLAVGVSFAVHVAIVIGIRWQPALPLPADPVPLEVVLSAGAAHDKPVRATVAAPPTPATVRPDSTPQRRHDAPKAKADRPVREPAPRTRPETADIPASEPAPRPSRHVPAHQATPRTGTPSFTTGDLLADARALARADSDTAAPPAAGAASRRAVISATTRDAVFASYAEDWRRKMERVGNLNYPQDARDKGVYGRLKLRVDIRADGSLIDVRIQRGSGHPELDDAAIRIVRLAAPFAPFPPALARDYDQLAIIRSWNFTRDNQFAAGN